MTYKKPYEIGSDEHISAILNRAHRYAERKRDNLDWLRKKKANMKSIKSAEEVLEFALDEYQFLESKLRG